MIDAIQLKALLETGETDRVERTQSTSDTNKFCEAICAFCNDLPDHRKPGYLIIGVAKDGRPTGVNVTDELLLNLAAHRDNGEIIPPPVMNVAKVIVGDAEVAVVEVFPCSAPPVRYKGRTYVRVGPRKAIATIEEERILSERRVHRAQTWDARGCMEASLDDLALELFQLSYLPNAVSRDVLEANQRSIPEQMAALRLYDRGMHRPTHAAVLLFGKDPAYFFPGAYVQYVEYHGTSPADDVRSEQRIAGDLLAVMRDLDRLAQRLGESLPLRQANLTDVTVFQYPPIALHEILMNAVIHRNYEGSTAPAMVNRFSDRIEVHNPGALYGELSKSRFPSGTAYRNPIIAEAAKTLGFVNRFGRGIAIAQAEMRRNGNPPIEFDIGENHLAAILRARS